MKKTSITTMLIFLLLVVSLPVYATGNGKLAADGNLAVGTGAIVVDGADNTAAGAGAVAILGDGNTSIGTGAIIEDGKKNNAIGLGAITGLGDNNGAIGTGAIVIDGEKNSAYGIGAAAGMGDNNLAVGTGAIVEGGKRNNAAGVGAIAGLGNENYASGVGSQVLAGVSNASLSGIGAIAGAGDHNTAVGIGTLVGSNAQIGVSSGSEAMGFGAQASGMANKAIGYGAQAVNGNSNTALGSGAYAGDSDLNTAIGYRADARAGNSVALGAYSIAYEPDTVSVGQPGYERRITNVAPGIYGTDAVNMSQLWHLDAKVNRVGASAFAMSALVPLAYDPKDPTQYSAGIGTYNGTQAVALGVFHYTKPTILLNAAIAMSDDGWEKSARFGITWRTGGPKEKPLIPAMAPAASEQRAAAGEDNIVIRVNKIVAGNDEE
ncbi:MAG: YadA-like family protein [Negativicutes bacterium]|nr:YadA-like family protein [Negativicutes bacterium]